MSSQRIRNIKIAGLYLVSIAALLSFYWMENSTELREFVEKADRYRSDWGFFALAVLGLVQYGLLIVGIFTPLTLTILIVLQKRKEYLQRMSKS